MTVLLKDIVRRPPLLAALVFTLLLAGCSGGGAPVVVDDGTPGGGNTGGNNGGNTGGTDPGDGVTGVNSDSALLLARSSLDMVAKLVAIGNIANVLLPQNIDLLSGPQNAGRDIPQCLASGYGIEHNQVSYRVNAPGYQIPAGPSLHVAFSHCTIEGINISDFLDITAIDYEAEGGFGDWHAEAEIYLDPVTVDNGNNTAASLTDHMHYTAVMEDGVLTTTLEVGADAGAGVIGGLNTQHFGTPINGDTRYINYQFRPFRIRTVDDPNTGQYTVAIEPHAEGASTLVRYTGSPVVEVRMRIATTPGLPVLWQGGRPDNYNELPASGEIGFSEFCAECGSLVATVDGAGAVLTITADGGVTTQNVAWSTLLAPPGAP